MQKDYSLGVNHVVTEVLSKYSINTWKLVLICATKNL